MKKYRLKVDVLKVAHHGSKTSTSPKLLEEHTIKYAIISAGKNNIYHHPHQEVLNRLTNQKIKNIVFSIPNNLLTMKHKEYIIMYLIQRRDILLKMLEVSDENEE